MTLKTASFCLVTVALLVAQAAPAQEASFAASLDDPAWDGITVPEGQHCSRKGGVDPHTPQLKVTGIPAAATALLIEINDRDYRKLSKAGGHGTILFELAPGAGTATVPPVPEGTMELPMGIEIYASHRGNFKKRGYYAPCSGGREHAYEAVVKAVILSEGGGEPQVLAHDRVALGRY